MGIGIIKSPRAMRSTLRASPTMIKEIASDVASENNKKKNIRRGGEPATRESFSKDVRDRRFLSHWRCARFCFRPIEFGVRFRPIEFGVC